LRAGLQTHVHVLRTFSKSLRCVLGTLQLCMAIDESTMP